MRRSEELIQPNQRHEVPNTSRKRNFKRLLEMDSQIPNNLYYPDENHFLLRNQFKKLKLSHDQELRQQV
jgi:hypothetical protein